MTVDGAIIRSVAELRVVFHRDHRVDGDDGAGITSSLERAAGLTDCSGHLVTRCFTVVHQLIADADGVDKMPIAFDGFADFLTFARYLVNVENAQEERNSFALGCGKHILDLIAIRPVKTNHRIAADQSEILGYLGGGFATVVGVVGRIRNPGAKSRTALARRRNIGCRFRHRW